MCLAPNTGGAPGSVQGWVAFFLGERVPSPGRTGLSHRIFPAAASERSAMAAFDLLDRPEGGQGFRGRSSHDRQGERPTGGDSCDHRRSH